MDEKRERGRGRTRGSEKEEGVKGGSKIDISLSQEKRGGRMDGWGKVRDCGDLWRELVKDRRTWGEGGRGERRGGRG